MMAILMLVLTEPGCGGTSADEARPSVLDKSFESKATAVCKTVLSQKRKQGPFPYPDFNPTRPDLSKLPSIARMEGTTVKIYQRWLGEFRALGQPRNGRPAWAEVMTSLTGNLQAIADQQAAGERVDGQRFTRDYYVGNRFQKELEQASDAASLPVCASAAAA
jgi:hypothetical protein